MKNTIGNSISVTLFGESHGPAVGTVLDGMAPGITVDEAFIQRQMSLRRSVSALSTPRKESDTVKIISGVYNGKTTGTPITLIIENENTKSSDYSITQRLARPGHADYTAYEKYHGYNDYRGGGHFSGRITAALTAAGAIAISALRLKGIKIGTHIAKCAGICDRNFENTESDIDLLSNKDFAVLSEESEIKMTTAIKNAKKDGDSVGGVLETAVTGMPVGVGEPWFDSVESVISHILFSIPAVKGVEFGDGFSITDKRGSEANDSFYSENGIVKTRTNHCGGILGGITNGMPIIIRTAVKPTPSIYKEQRTVDFKKKADEIIKIEGRHDPAVIHRARVVADSCIALALCDILAERFGTDYFMGD